MGGRYEHCLWLRAQAAEYIGCFLQKRGINDGFLGACVRICYPTEDGKTRSLTIAIYWDQGF